MILDVAADFDLGGQECMDESFGIDRGTFEVDPEGGWCVGDVVLDHIVIVSIAVVAELSGEGKSDASAWR